MKALLLFLNVCIILTVQAQNNKAAKIIFHPIHHASLVIEYGELTIYVDPASDFEKLKQYPKPDIILITHTHGDHLNPELLNGIKTDQSIIIGNKAAVDELGYGIYLLNGEKKMVKGVYIEAIAMYNTSDDRLMYHKKNNGNGYVITLGSEKVYISGDTEDTKEMRALKNIDYAFVCMNLPFTMTPEQAASAVIEFNPKVVYPYHYNQGEGFADIEKFKKLVTENSSTKVILSDWYSKKN
ncbi:MAG: MBL fold metallo-hydrolase [Prolixibacteraceae bacterium]